MACDRKTLMLISCYADGEATAEEAARATEHLETCADCRKLVEEWRGQRQLLEWACTFELPDEVVMDIPKREGQVAVVQSGSRRPGWVRLRWKLAGLTAAAVAIAALAIYHMATLPPVMGVGKTVVAGTEAACVRVEDGVVLRISPNSRVTRTGAASIRLDGGSVAAEVRHGTGFTVVTPRVRVMDQGTKFWVGTGPEIDCVTVDEGVVLVEKGSVRREVSAGQVLIARGTGVPEVVSPLAPKEDTEDVGSPLVQDRGGFEPAGAQSLDWREGIAKLAERFPDGRIGSASGGGAGSGTGGGSSRTYRYEFSGAAGLRKAFRAHFREIAQALAGGTVEGEWEMPTAYILVDGIAGPPEMPAGVYYVRLVCGGGKLRWRVSGADGRDADFPLALANEETLTRGSGSSGGGPGPLHYAICVRDRVTPRFTIVLADWPGKVKPVLSLDVRSMLISDVFRNDQPMLDDVARQTAGVSGLDLKDVTPTVLYLDPARKHRFLLMWNSRIEGQIRQAREGAKRGRGRSILMGVVATDVPWMKPNLPEGVYLLWWVLPSRSMTPRWEVSTPDMQRRIVLTADPQRHESSTGTWAPDNDTMLKLSIGRQADSGFRFGFTLGLANEGAPESPWGDGWIVIRKP